MEKKNTVLLTVIAVATLLVAVVGATFAYFTATNPEPTQLEDATGNASTAVMASVKLEAVAAGNSTNVIYPGTKNYAAIHVTASKEENSASVSDDYDVTYKVKGTISVDPAFEKGDVSYQVYRTTAAVADETLDGGVIKCTLSNADSHYTDSCQLASALGEQQKVSGASGTLAIGSTEENFEFTDTLSTTGTTEYYYYVVAEYVDNPSGDQSKDAGGTKTLTYSFTDVTDISTAVKAD